MPGDVAAVVARRERLQVAVVRRRPCWRRSRAVRAHRPCTSAPAAAHVHRAAVHVRQVVLEGDDRRRARAAPAVCRSVGFEQVRRHAGVVLVDEAQVGTHEAAFARVGARRGGRERMAMHDLLEQRRGADAGAAPAHVALAAARSFSSPPARTIALAKSSRPCSSSSSSIASPRTDAIEQAEVGAREQPDVVGVLAVDALEALGDHQPHAGRAFGHHGCARASCPCRSAGRRRSPRCRRGAARRARSAIRRPP